MVPAARAPLADLPQAPLQERPWPSVYLLPALDSAPAVVCVPDARDPADPVAFALARSPGRRMSERPVCGRPLPVRDLLWRQFWAGLVVALVSFGLAFAASLAGTGRAPSVLAVRFLGWPALLLPIAVLGVALRTRGPGKRARPDAALLGLGLVLEVAALVRLHAVLGVLAGAG